MSDPENTTQPLIGPPSQAVINVGAPAHRGRSSQAYKVAGLTLLACVLIAGQVMIGYFLLSQRSDIKSLEEQSYSMQAEMSKGRNVAPVRMHIPMHIMPALADESVDEEASTESPEKAGPQHATKCQLEASGMMSVQMQGFTPVCDVRGLYQAQQCYMGHCWCVNPVTGQEIPGSIMKGAASCKTSFFAGGLSNVLTMADADEN